jgi:uncharacterized membrane protein
MWQLFVENLQWMGWNLFLAAIPMLISLVVFRYDFWKQPSIWFIPLVFGVLVYFFFLPNGPYVITDVIHLVRQIKDYRYFHLSDWDIVVVLIPQFMAFIFIGFSFYVIGFQRMIHLLYQFRWPVWVIWIIKVAVAFVMAVGVFLGRFYRFNTWDIIGNSDKIIMSTIKEFTNFSFIMFVIVDSLVIFFGFEIVSIFYKSLFKPLFAKGSEDDESGIKNVISD